MRGPFSNSVLSFALVAVGAVMAPSFAAADLAVSFSEGAPKDRFRFENTSACPMTDMTVVLDLSSSQAGLIFDVTAEGAGVEVFQPFQIIEGESALKVLPTVLDGQSQIMLEVAQLRANESIAFTIDVDDTGGAREITVSGSEIQGASVRFVQDDVSGTAIFSDQARAMLPVAGCLS